MFAACAASTHSGVCFVAVVDVAAAAAAVAVVPTLVVVAVAVSWAQETLEN